MKQLEINDYQFNSIYPETIISKNSLPYKKTNEKLLLFLSNNFSKNGLSNYKFPIFSPRNNKKHIKKQKTIVKNSPNSTKDSLRSLIDSLRRDLYISYNYYDNTKGRLQSAKNGNNSIKLIKKKSYNNINKSNSINDSNINNPNLLSFDSKSNISNINLFNINSHKLKSKSKTILFKNDNSKMNSFSFTKYILSHRVNKTRNTSTPQTPTSTRYRSKMKTNTLKLEYDSLLLGESINKNKSIKRSSFSYELKNRNEKPLNMNNKFKTANIKQSREQRKFHQKLNLNHLKEQVHKFEESNAFYVDDLQLQSNLINPFKFQRNQFKKRIKKAEKANDFFFKRSRLKSIDKYEHLQFKRKNNKKQSPHQNICNEKSQKLIKKIQNLQNKAISSKNIIKNIDFRLRTKNLKKIVEFVVPIHHNVKEMDEQFKEDTINYQKNIGQFFIYKGSGLYSSHFSTFLKGDKIVKKNIKLEDDL